MADKIYKDKIGQGIDQVTPLATQADHVPQWGQVQEAIDAAVGGAANAGDFIGVLDVSGGYKYYDDYALGAVVNFSLSETKVLGSIATVRVRGDLMGTIPTVWNLSGQPITTNIGKENELTLLYVSDSDIRVVNRVVNYNDTEAPTVPQNLISANTTAFTTTLSWDDSTDNVGVASYNVYKDSILIDNVPTNVASIDGLEASTAYSFTVSALDGNGNESGQSTASVVNTLASQTATPLSLPNLHIWHDGTDQSSMTLSGTNEVLNLADKNSVLPLVYKTGVNPIFNTNLIQFRGGNLGSTTPSSVLVPTQDFHGFFIFRDNGTTINDYVSNRVSSSSRFAISLKTGNLAVGTYNGSFNSKSVAFTDTISTHYLEFKNIAGVLTAYLDGVLMTDTLSPYTGVADGFRIGSTTSEQYVDMDFRDLFVQSGEMTSTERTNMLDYINSKYGI